MQKALPQNPILARLRLFRTLVAIFNVLLWIFFGLVVCKAMHLNYTWTRALQASLVIGGIGQVILIEIELRRKNNLTAEVQSIGTL